MTIKLRLKRIYDEPAADDGYRVLIDRLWPRGVSKTQANIDLWAKGLTPSNELRKWFHAGNDREAEFACRYQHELEERSEEVAIILASLPQGVITLVTATKDLKQGHAAVLKEYLEENH